MAAVNVILTKIGKPIFGFIIKSRILLSILFLIAAVFIGVYFWFLSFKTKRREDQFKKAQAGKA